MIVRGAVYREHASPFDQRRMSIQRTAVDWDEAAQTRVPRQHEDGRAQAGSGWSPQHGHPRTPLRDVEEHFGKRAQHRAFDQRDAFRSVLRMSLAARGRAAPCFEAFGTPDWPIVDE